MNIGYAILEFYVSLVAYTILHMIFVISSDFVEAFNIPPLNIGIYVDKLAAIRALLMVIADILEWGLTQKALGDTSMMKALNDSINIHPYGARRIGSLISYFAMLMCRIVYLWLIYKSDNKSLSVFITLCIEGFWFGTFQMGFFAIGPEYNAYTSLGIHTMGNFIFFLQLILQHRAKSKPKINCLYRVRVHAWICLITSVIALILWLYFCGWVTAAGEDAPSEWPGDHDVWSPFWLFIVGAFAEDFAVPGVLPFAFLDPEKANLVNYLTPVFFMTGAILIVLWNDWTKDESKFKDWSASTYANKGLYWHSLWLLNIPKYIAFFIAMLSIHGTFADLRCIIQSRWRVMLLTMFVVVPRATLEVAGYVGVANYAIGRADLNLVVQEKVKTLAKKLNNPGSINSANPQTSTVKSAINNQNDVKDVIADLIKVQFWGAVVADKDPSGTGKDITAEEEGTQNKLKVLLQAASDGTGDQIATGQKDVDLKMESSAQKGVTVTIKIKRGETGSLVKTGSNNENNNDNAETIAKKIADAVGKAPTQNNEGRSDATGPDFGAFAYIAYHDMLAMFCRFVYGKFAVGYNWTNYKLL